MKKLSVLLVTTATLLGAQLVVAQPGQPPAPAQATAPRPVRALGWETNLEKGLAQSAESGKPLMVFFSSKSIPPCSAMKNEVLSRAKLQALIAKHVELVEIDVDDQPEVASKFKVNELPGFVILDAKGAEIDRFGGFLPIGAFLETLKMASNPAMSIPELERRIKADENDMGARWILAQKHARDKNRDGLDKMLVEMRELDPKNEKGYLDRVAYLELMTSLNPKMPDEGFKAAERFLQEFPQSKVADEVDMARAQLAYQMGDKQKSIEILRAFPGKYPNSKLADRVARDLAAQSEAQEQEQ